MAIDVDDMVLFKVLNDKIRPYEDQIVKSWDRIYNYDPKDDPPVINRKLSDLLEFAYDVCYEIEKLEKEE